jgi:hypothetical protein
VEDRRGLEHDIIIWGPKSRSLKVAPVNSFRLYDGGSGGQWCGGWKIAKTAQPQDANVLHSRPSASSEIGSAIPIYSFIRT